MGEVKIVRQVTKQWLDQEGVANWPLQEKGVSAIPQFHYADKSFYIVAGKVLITPGGEDEVHLHAGDFVTLPKGLACYWEILEPLRIHCSGAGL